MNVPLQLPKGTYRPTFAIIDLEALGHNLREIRKLLPPDTRICAVVKADAYGHGAVPVSREMEVLGVGSLAVATVEEGIDLREAGIRIPILVIALGDAGVREAIDQDLTPVIYSEACARRIQDAAAGAGKTVPVHLKLDTGMGRIGLLPDQWAPVLQELLANPRIRVEGILSHFSSAGADPAFTEIQARRFGEVLDHVRRLAGRDMDRVHIANSAGIIRSAGKIGNMVRPGIALYGAYPDQCLIGKVSLRPVMSFLTRVLHVKSLPAGCPISYGQTFRTERPSRIATLPVGYADGYRRDLSNLGEVLIRGRRAPVAGTVTMDLTMVDVTDVPGACEGDEVTLFGSAPDGMLRVDEVAEWIGTIPYELTCGVSKRVPRIYVKGNW